MSLNTPLTVRLCAADRCCGRCHITVANAIMSDDQRIRFRVLSRIASIGVSRPKAQPAILDRVKARTCAGADRLATFLPCAP